MNSLNKIISCVCVFFLIWSLRSYPYHPILLSCFLTGYAWLLFRFPFVWLFCLPALLPVMDFAPLSGWFFYDEFDFVVLTTIAVKAWQFTPDKSQVGISPSVKNTLYFLWISVLISTLIGLFPLQNLDVNAFSNYHSHYNSLRIAKGFFWAFLLLPFFKKDLGFIGNYKTYLIPGILTGLAGAGLYILWERQVFSGLINFDSRFRITGPFSGMHIGGAWVDAFLAGTLPFISACFFWGKNRIAQLFGVFLFIVGVYSLLVTFSRIVYLAFFISALVLIVSLFFITLKKRQLFFWGGIFTVLFCLVLIPVLHGHFIQSRFSYTIRDIGTRLHHWQSSFEMMDSDFFTRMFGMGLGSYPRVYAQRSTEHERPSFYKYIEKDKNTFLQLSPGGFLYMGQKVSLKPNTSYLLTFTAKSTVKDVRLVVPVCEKSLLHSFRFKWLVERINQQNKWIQFEMPFNSGDVGKGRPIYQKRPVYLSFFNGHPEADIDIDNVSLIDDKGRELIKNGDFSNGYDFWFFTADNHLPWHMKNLWCHILFEQGWIGLLIFSYFCCLTIFIAVRNISAGDCYSLIVLSSIAGIFTVGLVDSLFDFPRLILFFFILSFSVIFQPGPMRIKGS